MANSVVRLSIDSQEFDANIKRAGEALNKFFDQARKGDRTFEVLDDDAMEVIKTFGRMETSSKSARGQLSELTKGFTDLSLVYKRLTDQEKASPVGREMSRQLGELKTRIQDTKKDLADIADELNGKSASSSGGGFGTMLAVFGGNVMTKAASMLTSEITSIVKKSSELSTQAEGIQIAFGKLGRGDILDGLRNATHNTVSDLELMKAAVKFNDFKLPLDQLGTMLAFAQQKAKDTGQSVDYMVESIVNGLGRKSIQILDNLGISASEIRERMKETGDMTKAVGDIIREQMEKAGDYVETAADRAAQANVELENQMLKLGEAMREVFGFEGWDQMANSIKGTLASVLSDVIGQLGEIKGLLSGITPGQARQKKYGTSGTPDEVERDLKALQDADEKEREKMYNKMLAKYENRYNSAASSLAKAQGGYDFNESSSNWKGVPFVRKALDRHYWSTQVNTARSNAQVEGDVLAAFKSGANNIFNPPAAHPDKVNPVGNISRGGNTPVAEATYELLEDVRKEKPKVFDFMDATSNVTASMKDLQQQLKLYKDILANATTQDEYNVASSGIAGVQREMKLQPIALEGGITIAEAEVETIGASLKENLEAYFKENPIEFKSDNIAQDGKKAEKAWQQAASAVQSVGSAFSQIEDPGVKAMGTVMQAIASIALGFAQASAQAGSMGPWAWLAFLAAGAAATATTIATIHSLTGYAEGGIVKGNSYSGDNIGGLVDGSQFVGLNAGELVLNASQQGTLADALISGSNQGGGGSGTPYVTGEKIVMGVNNWGRATGRGELVFSKS